MELDGIPNLVRSLSRPRRVCSFKKVDLHVHSPASPDYDGAKNVSPNEFVAAFASRGFDLIAITDHNTGEFVDKAIEASREIESDTGSKLTILPGAEIYVSHGIHLLVILPDGGSSGISDLLSRLGLPSRHHGDTNKMISQPVVEIAREVSERKGLLIGAHCNSSKGIVQELEGQTRKEWLHAVDALEIRSDAHINKITNTINYVNNELGMTKPFVFGSDSHDCALENTGMWVKMAEPTLASLRQVTFEPDLRVSRIEPVPPKHGRIVGFTSTEGIYGEERFRFSPNLNVLIGGRGAGKSAAIDLLRFAFEASPRANEGKSEVLTDRIMGFLKGVGDVIVTFVGTDGQTYVIVRSGAYDPSSGRTPATFKERAQVYQVVGEELIPRELRPTDLLDVEFYGQGEVVQLADRVEEQLRLIDENIDRADAVATIVQSETKLVSGASELIKCKRELEDLLVVEATRSDLEERRDSLAESLDDPIFAERKRWEQEKSWFDEQQDWLQRVSKSLPVSIAVRAKIEIDTEESQSKSLLERVRAITDRISDRGQFLLERTKKRMQDAESELATYRKQWDTKYRIADREYRSRLTELGAADLSQAAAEQREIEGKLTRIETITVPEINRIKAEITSLEAERIRLLSELKDARTELDASRSEFADKLNARLGGNVVIDLTERDKSLFVESIDGMLRGSGMHGREDQVLRACNRFSPETFVNIIRTGAKGELTSLGITENSALTMINTLTEANLYEIEKIDVPPLPRIRIKKEGDSTYTNLSSLSVGEKCSAILSIALLSKGKPLVIDQPEDDLDHAFIIDSIVEGIRQAKSERQIIAATHNPNIPVLGDAEMVLRVSRRPGDDVCEIQNSGGLEVRHITVGVQALEGGVEAFERRRARYSSAS